MRQTINNFTIIKLIEINFVVYVLRQKKNLIINFFFSYTYYFSFTNRNPLQFALFPLFSCKRTTLSLMLFSYYQMAEWPQLIPSTFLPLLRVRPTQSLCPRKWKEDFVYCLNEVSNWVWWAGQQWCYALHLTLTPQSRSG